ncbi:MAG: hypothetical protein H0U79_04565 [Solirubrobacterales bacterium]|nr:hypothetical protein [Solirubrobacterales bacterium]
MDEGDRYNDALRGAREEVSDAREVFFHLAYADIRNAADLLRPVVERAMVRAVTSPSSCRPTSRTTSRARSPRRGGTVGDRPGEVLIKVPGTAEGLQAFEELTGPGALDQTSRCSSRCSVTSSVAPMSIDRKPKPTIITVLDVGGGPTGRGSGGGPPRRLGLRLGRRAAGAGRRSRTRAWPRRARR